AEVRPRLPIDRASTIVVFSTANHPRPSGPSHRPTITLEPTVPRSISSRVPIVSDTPEAKLPKTTGIAPSAGQGAVAVRSAISAKTRLEAGYRPTSAGGKTGGQ